MAVDVMETDELVTEEAVTPQKYLTPSFTDADAMSEFIVYMQSHIKEHGVRSVLKNSYTAIKHFNIAERYAAKVHASIARMNGQRTPSQQRGDTVRGLTLAARKFYKSCTDRALEANMKAADLNPKLYTTRDEKIEALMKVYKTENQS